MSDPNVSEDLIRSSLAELEGLIMEAEDIAERKKTWRAECKGAGLDPKQIERVAKLKREKERNADKVDEEDAIFELYKDAAGVQ